MVFAKMGKEGLKGYAVIDFCVYNALPNLYYINRFIVLHVVL